MKVINSFIGLLVVCLLASCKGYSVFSLDDKYAVNIDTSLFGIWKAVEDTNNTNFILVQEDQDLFLTLSEVRRLYGSVANYITRQNADMEMQTGEKNFHSKDTTGWVTELEQNEGHRKLKKQICYLTYFDRGGKNPHYLQWDSKLYQINKSKFLNLYYPGPVGGPTTGFIYLRFLRISNDTITTALVNDGSLCTLNTAKEVNERIAANVHNKAFFADTTHFYKVKSGHFSPKVAIALAH